MLVATISKSLAERSCILLQSSVQPYGLRAGRWCRSNHNRRLSFSCDGLSGMPAKNRPYPLQKKRKIILTAQKIMNCSKMSNS